MFSGWTSSEQLWSPRKVAKSGRKSGRFWPPKGWTYFADERKALWGSMSSEGCLLGAPCQSLAQIPTRMTRAFSGAPFHQPHPGNVSGKRIKALFQYPTAVDPQIRHIQTVVWKGTSGERLKHEASSTRASTTCIWS